MKKLLISSLLATVLLAACTEENKLSFESVEGARKTANENAEYNAKAFRASHPDYATWVILTASDSTQSEKCGSGDGWETITFEHAVSQLKVPIKCSTVSATLGCMSDAEFKTKSYAARDGKCDTTLPFPLPKIQN